MTVQTQTEPAGLTVLGATGTIGVNTLDIVRRHPGRFRVVALTAATQVERLYVQCLEFQPKLAVLSDPLAAEALAVRLRARGVATEVASGPDACIAAAGHPDASVVMAAIVGAAGLMPTLEAARHGKRVLLANKEALVMTGGLFIGELRRHGASLVPIDSEHNAIFQCLPRDFAGDLCAAGVRRILLTASGGPFRSRSPESVADVTPEEACRHPNWVMGRKISVDSATMMNKALEVIEAHWLFGAPPSQIEVLVHPQSVVHSMVEYRDGSVLAQLGQPDMRTPIAYGLGFPARIDAGVEFLDLLKTGRLEFEAPDPRRFPCLPLAWAALAAGGTSSAVLNAANEVAVEAFLGRRLRFGDIAPVIETVLAQPLPGDAGSVAGVLEADAAARRAAGTAVARRAC
ncbi:MAG: 1-deoxy-D-xylulose-5-phosphate reductoisomerase [Rhodocyclaceae bacterium]|jgi:1-deoxy-D-xylulose-5-phosphate reductoisomerase|nr:1-deoxy-D-xylulose-5-phosphate reductoisomerase [Rhodocyclaceae bacterium]MCA3074635.1 1-deoxy-D-xylulose-5-phosphate reductoisomerase [Rhodocyclaceae bacterium]MCA3088892.1 1-deoxy-D-xylulose-5-phosphate reductoisomerase [Rhodocyclaceae bacterium]MCA3095628.1 1-deoxy-D-xylulose-5-phosphate reductoisomerase [Rhodocyclaceae bacterium]MCA3097635.1 1-deoxy-D-xylulose-5-phosphate reductoisomerase [Rhodocyclaceae bacterium]